jgi:hypothetical protein
MRDIHRKNPHWGLIRLPEEALTRAGPRGSKAALQFWAQITSARSSGSSLPTKPGEEFPYERHRELNYKWMICEITADEQLEFDALSARDPVGDPKRLENDPLYHSYAPLQQAIQKADEEAASFHARYQKSTARVAS